MYLAHYGMRQPPFNLAPDTQFYLPRASHQEALNTLLVALRSGEGFVKLTGEVGLGKTLICRKLLHALGEEYRVAYVPHPPASPKALYLMLAEELGCRGNVSSQPEKLLARIGRKLVANARAGFMTVLVIDEAQTLSDETLEAVRLLTNLETERAKLLQVVLIGQPELDVRLQQENLRQLLQRITFSHTLQPLDYDDFVAYVRHRLRVAGATSDDLFDADALRLLYRASRGVPRLINILCHKALLASFGPGRPRVERGHAVAAITDTAGIRPSAGLYLSILAHENAGLMMLALLLSLGLAAVLGAL